jgi:hypothetical protein
MIVGLPLQTARLEATATDRALAAARLLKQLAEALMRLSTKVGKLPGADLQVPLVHESPSNHDTPENGGAFVEEQHVALVERLKALERSFAAFMVRNPVDAPPFAGTISPAR